MADNKANWHANFNPESIEAGNEIMSKKFELQICMGSSCFSRGNKELAVFIKDYLKKNHLDDRVVFRGARCLGHCTYGPAIVINDRIIDGVGITDIEALLDKELSNLT